MGPQEQVCSCGCSGGGGIEGDGRGREYGVVVLVKRVWAECRPLTMIAWQLHYFLRSVILIFCFVGSGERG